MMHGQKNIKFGSS